MKVDGKDMRPIWLDGTGEAVKVIDQRMLPHKLVIADLRNLDEIITAIKEMYVRGAPLIGATAAWGVYLIVRNGRENGAPADYIRAECQRLKAARPTAVNLAWAVDRMMPKLLEAASFDRKLELARSDASAIAELEAENCRLIGVHGLPLIKELSERKGGKTVNLMTHCNAGWLACVEWGTATAPMYAAHEAGIDIHVWVDETRPLNQGARLTAWELGKAGIKHTVITDNAGGHLMQHGLVDMLITGTDRTTHTGDVANKIGTYLKALAARDNGVPFYVALPSTTFDWKMKDGVAEIPIEERDPDEIRYIQGLWDGDIRSALVTTEDGPRDNNASEVTPARLMTGFITERDIRSVLVPPADSPCGNYAFDVTPARLVTGFITERGVCEASEAAILGLFPEYA